MTKFLLLTMAAIVASVARAEIAFTGYVGAAAKAYFNLTNAESKTNAWVSLSQTFQGYKLVRFDAEKRVLCLENGTETLELRLSGSNAVSAGDDVADHDRVMQLDGMELAVALAMRGDEQLSDLLARYHSASDAQNTRPGTHDAVGFLEARLIAVAAERKKAALAGASAPPSPKK